MDKALILEIAQTAIKEYMRIYDRGVKEAFFIFGIVLLVVFYRLYRQVLKNEKLFQKIEKIETDYKGLELQNKEIVGYLKVIQTDLEYLKKKE